MTVAAERIQREQLRIHLGLEIEHDAQYTGLEASDADRLDVRIVGLDVLRELRELRGQLDIVEVEHQPRGILHHEHLVRDRSAGLEDQPRVLLRRPQARRGNRRREQWRRHQPLRRRQQQPLARAPARELDGDYGILAAYAARHALPASVRAASASVRPAPECSSESARSTAASHAATRSGHSITHTASGRKYSAKPVLSHSSDRRNDKNQSDRSISSKVRNVQPERRSDS